MSSLVGKLYITSRTCLFGDPTVKSELFKKNSFFFNIELEKQLKQDTLMVSKIKNHDNLADKETNQELM